MAWAIILALDTSLRNRLTGAIILIVIAVALLPELLTGAGSKGRLALDDGHAADGPPLVRSEEHTSELQSH